MVNAPKNPDYDPLDPFASTKKTYHAADIRNSRAGVAKQKIHQLEKSKNSEFKKYKKKASFIQRIRISLKELSEREDRKKIYFRFSLSIIIILAFILTYLIFFAEKINEIIENNNQKIRMDEAIAQANAFEEGGNSTASIELIEKELESIKTPNERILLLANLARLYYENGEKEKALAAYGKILAYPETEDLEINGLPWGGVRETYLEEYNRIKNE